MRVVALSILAASVLTGAGAERPASADRPNVVLIMADDMGLSDVGCYGGEIETPALDRLAAGGLRFTRFYNNNMCVPTRAALLTGVYHTTSLRSGHVNERCVTIAEALGAAGYATSMSGKWHLSKPKDRAQWPPQRGFDRFFGTIHGAGSFFAPASLMRDNENAEEEFKKPGFYYTRAISDNAVRFIDEAPKEKPLFLYVAYTAPHWPLHALEEDVAKVKGKYAAGWDEMRARRHKRMKELGIVDPDWPLSPRHPDVPAWKDEPNKKWQERRMEVYAAQIDRMDRGIGRVVDALKRAGRFENTLLMFLIDNGGCHVEYRKNRKGPYLPAKTRDGRPVRPGNIAGLMPGPEDTYQSYGYGWANASNTPFRLFKQFCHEGGIRTPLIVHWPGKIPQPGKVVHDVGHVIDVLPTCLDAAGADYPGTFKKRKIHPVDGKSLLPVFKGGTRKAHPTLFWHWAHGRAVRQGDTKLVRVDKKAWELYEMGGDGTELKDLSDGLSGKAKELQGLWEAWSKRTRALE